MRETVASIAALTTPVRHVVVAPASCRADLATIAPAAELVSDQGLGMYAALNRGLSAAADWDVFTWINDDDALVASGFGRALDAMIQKADNDVIFGRVKLLDGASARIGEIPVVRRQKDIPALLARSIIPFAQPGTIIRRRMWDLLGGFDPAYRNAGDLDFFVRAYMAGARFAFVDAEVAAFRLSAGQLSKRLAEVEEETARALRPLAGYPPSMAAWVRFRADNFDVYLERLRRHGWISMRGLYDRTT